MITVSNVTKTYNGSYNAIDNVNLEIKSGEIFGLLGPNGAGKTTMIKMTTGIINPTVGDIEINEISIRQYPIEAKEQFGFVPDNPDMFLRLTGDEYLNFIADIYGVSNEIRDDLIFRLALKFEMQGVLRDKIQSYSHGMRQKIIIMGVLLHNPRVWIMDEPMTGLDPKSAYELKLMMREHAEDGNTVLISTHVLEVTEKLCDRVGILNKGKLMFVGTVDELKNKYKNDESLEEIFLEMTQNE